MSVTIKTQHLWKLSDQVLRTSYRPQDSNTMRIDIIGQYPLPAFPQRH